MSQYENTGKNTIKIDHVEQLIINCSGAHHTQETNILPKENIDRGICQNAYSNICGNASSTGNTNGAKRVFYKDGNYSFDWQVGSSMMYDV